MFTLVYQINSLSRIVKFASWLCFWFEIYNLAVHYLGELCILCYDWRSWIDCVLRGHEPRTIGKNNQDLVDKSNVTC